MPTTTLALGQANYELLDSIDKIKDTVTQKQLDSQNITETLSAAVRGGVINNVDIGVFDKYAFGNTSRDDSIANIASFNVADISRNLRFNDSDVPTDGKSLGNASNANINFFKSTSGDTIGLGGGNNRVNAAYDLTTSEIQALDGSDTVRIGGKADGSLVSLGSGSDQLTIGLGSVDFDADLGDGNDTALFQGSLTSNPTTERQSFAINDGTNVINMGAGDDRATFIGGVTGGQAGATGYEIQLGSGNDTAIFGSKSVSDGFQLNTGIGSDQVVLGKDTSNAIIDLGWDNASTVSADPEDSSFVPPSGDTVVLGLGASLNNSLIRSEQHSDLINLAGKVEDTALDLGSGNATVNVSGQVGFGGATTESSFTTDSLLPSSSESADLPDGGEPAVTVWDLGAGDDQVVFSSLSRLLDLGDGSGLISLGKGSDYLELSGGGHFDVGSIEFDLGNDGDTDTIVFGLNSSYEGVTISNFGKQDILFIGNGKYGYAYEFLNEFASIYDLDNFRSSSNVIWAQQDSPSEQAIMTLDSEQFVPTDNPYSNDEVMHDEYNPYTTDLDGNPLYDTTTSIVSQQDVDTLANESSWSSGSTPMSGDPQSQNLYYGPST